MNTSPATEVMPWIQAHLTIEKAQAPLVERLFEQLGALSVTMTDAEDQPMLEPSPGTTPLWRLTRITGLFPAELDTDELRNRVGSHLRETPDHNLILEALEDRAWERTWLEHFQPMRFGQRLWIRPTGQQVAATDAVVVDLDPGLAFGTGTHPTTALCLEWLDSIDLEDKVVIDYGCGSGILSVAALKLGARRALALDHDPQALEATRENARRNEVDDRLQILQEDEVAGIEADVLVANILANVLMELAPRITGLVRHGGQLALSGILEEQASEVASAYHPQIVLDPPACKEGWVLLKGTRQ